MAKANPKTRSSKTVKQDGKSLRAVGCEGSTPSIDVTAEDLRTCEPRQRQR